MELFTLDKEFQKDDMIEEFESLIWTERYYGDSDVELVVPGTPNLIKKLFPGTFLALTGTREVMRIETASIEDRKLKLKGFSPLIWLNNRFVRTSAIHKERTWYFEPQPIGQILWVMIKQMATSDSPYL